MAYTTINNPELYFQTVLWTGNATDRSITLGGDEDMQPDYVWIKNRGSAESHRNWDSVRGANKQLSANNTNTESTATEGLTAFDSDGFTIGTDSTVNENTKAIVAWCWKESATAGFDIVGYTGDGSNRTISHSLSAVPHLMILKSRTYAENWQIYHHKMASDPETDYLEFRNTAIADSATTWNDTAPTSSVFSVGTRDATNKNTYTYINYLWTAKQGFSKFGSYVGNGNADGVFIYTGFRPAYIMFKDVNNSNSWIIMDTKRDPENIMAATLYADDSVAESDTDRGDAVSNGFKCRGTSNAFNGSGRTYIYMAFAEAPFVNSKGVPCNAR